MGINPSIHHYVTYTMSIHHYVTLRHIYSPLRLIKSHLLIIPAHYVFIPTVSSTLRFITPHYAWYFSTNRGCNMLIWSITPLRHVFSSFYCITTHYGTLRPLRLLRPLRQIVTPEKKLFFCRKRPEKISEERDQIQCDKQPASVGLSSQEC